MSIRLGDDGTMDTVLVCTDCGQEFRFNYDPEFPKDAEDGIGPSEEAAYDAYVEQCIADVTEEHECGADEEDA